MNILVIGCGGIGGYFGARLSQNKELKVSVALNSNIEKVQKEGIKLKSIKGDCDFEIDRIFNVHKKLEKPDFDFILLATKALPTINQVQLLKNFVNSVETNILIIQNGIDTEKDILENFPENEIASAVTYIGVAKESGNIINHTGGDGILQIGVLNRKSPSEKLLKLIEFFNQQKVKATYFDNIRAKRYEKLLWNVPFNSLSVIGGGLLTNEMTDRAEIESLSRKIMQEVINVAASENIHFPKSVIDEKIEYTRNFPPYASSMLVDYRLHRKLEVEAIVGNILKIAEKNNISTPYIETVYAILKSVNNKIT
ncbi:MAG: 2-dehydropantoate 2-reductase [Lentisphaeria bacterium]|nr:2-dehydropantoate 2-reductase [Lentisphaeria bacterium]